MADKKALVEHWECFECDQKIEVRIITHDAEDAPNCYSVPPGCFITCMAVEDDEEEFVVFCNEKCVRANLAEYDLPEATG